MTASRQEREAAFHDHALEQDVRAGVTKWYAINRAGVDDYRRRLHEGLRASRDTPARVLEYGCGTGSQAFHLAAAGAHVDGIDISPVAIERSEEQARAEGVAHRTAFQVMDAEHLRFADASFDVVCGSGIIHHLDLDLALPEVARVLRPGGRAVFYEPLGHNPAINLFRRRTPALRTEDEHPLLMADLRLAARHAAHVDVAFFHLATLAAVPLRARRGFPAVLRGLEAVDAVLLHRRSPLRRWAWFAVIELRP